MKTNSSVYGAVAVIHLSLALLVVGCGQNAERQKVESQVIRDLHTSDLVKLPPVNTYYLARQADGTVWKLEVNSDGNVVGKTQIFPANIQVHEAAVKVTAYDAK